MTHNVETFVLAVDCGGTKVEAALVDPSGVVLGASRIRRPTGSTRSATELAAQVRSVVIGSLQELPRGASIAGIGVGSAGPIDLGLGLVSPVNLPAWRGFALRSLVESAAVEAGHPVSAVLRLDGLCIALAEHWVGAAVGHDTVLGMIVSTGIGGGIIVSGRPATGASGNAGHIGQIEVAGFTGPGTGLDDGSGSADGTAPGLTLEQIASGPSTVAWARAQGWDGSTGEDLAVAYRLGDLVAVRSVERSAEAIGRALASVSTLLDLDLVVIGGGFSRVTPDLFPLIRRSVERHAPFDYARRLEVLPTGLDTDGPLIGAAALVWGGVTDLTP